MSLKSVVWRKFPKFLEKFREPRWFKNSLLVCVEDVEKVLFCKKKSADKNVNADDDVARPRYDCLSK